MDNENSMQPVHTFVETVEFLEAINCCIFSLFDMKHNSAWDWKLSSNTYRHSVSASSVSYTHLTLPTILRV